MTKTLNLSDLLDGSIRTEPKKQLNLQNQTQEEIIENIRNGIHELYKRGLIVDPVKFHEHQLKAIQSLEDYFAGRIKPIPEKIIIDSYPSHIDHKSIAEKIKPAFIFDNVFSSLKGSFTSLINRHHSQYSIEELQRILQKHPNRMDLKMELMRLQRENKTKFIGRPKRKKRK